MRIGIIRESMLTFPGVKADEPIVDGRREEIKDVLGEKLGATLVESVDPRWPDDPDDREHDRPTYTQALAELMPVFFPDILYRLDDRTAQPRVPGLRREIKPTEFAPGMIIRHGTMRRSTTWSRWPTAGSAAGQPEHPHHPAAEPATAFRFHFVAVRDAPRRRLEGARLHRDAGRLPDAERALEVLGRRSARRVQELGGDRPTSATRSASAGHRRTHQAA